MDREIVEARITIPFAGKLASSNKLTRIESKRIERSLLRNIKHALYRREENGKLPTDPLTCIVRGLSYTESGNTMGDRGARKLALISIVD